MARYVIRPRATDCDWWAESRIQSVPTVSESVPSDTGLLDVKGNTIWRMPNPIGFGRDEEW